MQRFEDRLNDGVQPCKHISIPESYDPEACGSEKVVPATVIDGLIGVLTPVQFDDDSSIDRSEVADVEADLMLPAKLETAQLSPSKAAPEETLGIGLIPPEGATAS
jgi:hypothetical protein